MPIPASSPIWATMAPGQHETSSLCLAKQQQNEGGRDRTKQKQPKIVSGNVVWFGGVDHEFGRKERPKSSILPLCV